jgi:mono/diheme cytochrome c family protein
MIKRLVLLLGLVSVPLAIGLLFTYDVIKIDWISFMEIQSSYRAMEDPLPLPQQSVPVQGAAYIEELGAPQNTSTADSESLARGQKYYDTSCALCHGSSGDGKGNFSSFLTKYPPANLLDETRTSLSDGAIFMVITNGVEGRMPHLRENLPTAEMRWDVVNYVRQLQQQAK